MILYLFSLFFRTDLNGGESLLLQNDFERKANPWLTPPEADKPEIRALKANLYTFNEL
jgi:hypothetical protein